MSSYKFFDNLIQFKSDKQKREFFQRCDFFDKYGGTFEVFVSKKGKILIAEEHKHGLFRTIISKSGETKAIGSGHVDKATWESIQTEATNERK